MIIKAKVPTPIFHRKKKKKWNLVPRFIKLESKIKLNRKKRK